MKLISAVLLALSASAALSACTLKKSVNPESVLPPSSPAVTSAATPSTAPIVSAGPTLTDDQLLKAIDNDTGPDIDREFNTLEQELQ